jgi:NAD(P)-dependent dehydrogenase (short-subunit alcohol dehydrogenase family)
MSLLKDQVALVTGASSGIGAAIAEAFSREGAHVILAARTPEKLELIKDRIVSAGFTATSIQTDVSEEASVLALFDEIRRSHKSLDILVNNAGIGIGGPTEDLSFETWRKVMRVNLDGAFLCAREAFKIMKTQGRGRIINIGSVSAKMPRVNSAPYTTSKFALEGLTRSLALDGRAYGISVGVLQPGNTMTGIWEGRVAAVNQEGVMMPEDLAKVALSMVALPDGVSVLESTILPISMPFLGRG